MKLQNLPALRSAIAFIAGILISYFFHLNIYAAATGLFLIIIVLFFLKDKVEIKTYLFLVLLIFAGTLRFSLSNNSESLLRSIPDMYPKRIVNVIGIVNDIPDYDSNRVKFQFSLQKVITDNDTIDVKGNILVTSYKPVSYSEQNFKFPLVRAGDMLSIPGYLHDGAPERNPGEFDYKKYLKLHNIDKLFSNNDCTEIKFISSGNLGFFYQKCIFPLKLYVFDEINRSIPGNDGAFLNGLITGIRSDISEDVKNDFINSGTAHIIAVSGLNVIYIVLIITLLLILLRVPLIPRTIITIILLIYYCFFTGVTPSIVRATIMGSLILIAFVIQRKPVYLNIVGFSALIILLIDPKQLFDNGFILSFASLVSILIIFNRLEILFLDKIKDKSDNKLYLGFIRLIELALTTFAAIMGTLPFNIFMFGKVSISGLFANIVAIPVSNISLAIGIFQIGLSFISHSTSAFIAGVNYFLIKILLIFISFSAGLSFSYIKLYQADIYFAIIYYIIFFSILFLNRKNFKFISVLIFIVSSVYIFHLLSQKSEIKITFLDVGQGDCAIIQTSENKTIVVDCRLNATFVNSGERSIVPYLQRNGVEKIDLLIITHLHMDHIGGMKYLLENFPVSRIFESGQHVETEFVSQIDSIINAKHINKQIINAGFNDTEFKDMRLYFMFPEHGFINSDGMTMGNNLNNGSLVFKLIYKNSSILFSGDIEKYAEEDITTTYGDMLKSDLLKSPHHGSYTSSTIPFLNKIKPEYAVISCGKFNRFNHPSPIILERYSQDHIKTIRTDEDNAAVFEYKDGKLEEVEWK